MRRLTAVLLITLLLAVSILPVYAGRYSEGNSPSAEVVHSQGGDLAIGSDKDVGNLDLTYGVKEEFVVTIPEKVDLVLNTVTSSDVTVSNVHLPRAKSLVIKVSGNFYLNGAAAGWKLQNQDNKDVYLDYKVAQSDGGAAIDNNTPIITHSVETVLSGTSSTTLYFNVTGEPNIGGQDLDYLIFSVYIK